MKTTLILSAAATLLALSAGANAAVNAVDVPRISNGGTGYIGLTDSASQARPMPMVARWNAGAADTSGVPLRAGEASTLVNGQPNAFVQATDQGSPYATRVMGAGGAAASSMGWQGSGGDPRVGMGTPK